MTALLQMNKLFSFEVQILDSKGIKRRFRASNFQVCLIPSQLSFSIMCSVVPDKRVHWRSLAMFGVLHFCRGLFSLPQTTARVKPYLCTMPLRMDSGWVYVHLNLADLTRKAFGTNYSETSRVQVHATCRLKRIFFAEQPFREDQLPEELRLPLDDVES